MILRSILVSVALMTLAACDNTSARYSSDYAGKLSREEILILPANAEAYTVDAANAETRMYDYESHVEPILAKELQKQLRAKGYRVKLFPKKALKKDKTYREYAAFTRAFETAYAEAYKNGEVVKREDAQKTPLRLGGRGKALGEKLHAPVVAYIDYNETVRTAGGQAVDFVASVALQMLTGVNTSTPPDTAKAIVALVDLEEDKVLWTNAGASAGGGIGAGMIYTDEEQSRQHIEHSLQWSLTQLPARKDLFKKEE